ncbi:hypothetical protein EDB84DRAFT_1435477 [Lactarius hengduanensis]|nr:hypothetical protein EDB84DRAFT_1435477 [Lactarius hengduanensis]
MLRPLALLWYMDLSRASLPPEFKDTHIAAWQPVATCAGCSKDHLLRRTLSNAAHAHILAERPKAPEGGEALRLGPEYTGGSLDDPEVTGIPILIPPYGSKDSYASGTWYFHAQMRTRVASSVELREYGEDSGDFGISMEAKHVVQVRGAVRRENENMRHVRARCEYPLAMLVWKAFSKLEQKLNYDNSHPKTIPVRKPKVT